MWRCANSHNGCFSSYASSGAFMRENSQNTSIAPPVAAAGLRLPSQPASHRRRRRDRRARPANTLLCACDRRQLKTSAAAAADDNNTINYMCVYMRPPRLGSLAMRVVIVYAHIWHIGRVRYDLLLTRANYPWCAPYRNIMNAIGREVTRRRLPGSEERRRRAQHRDLCNVHNAVRIVGIFTRDWYGLCGVQ